MLSVESEQRAFCPTSVFSSITLNNVKGFDSSRRFNSAKKDNDFVYHETVPSLESLASVKGKEGSLPCVEFVVCR